MESTKLPTITNQQTAEVLEALVHLCTCAAPLITISPEERLAVPRVGPQREAFTRAALEAAFTHPKFIPRSINLMKLIGGTVVHSGLAEAREKLRAVLQQVEDTRYHLGAEIYSGSLEIYHLLKMHRSADDDLRAAVDEMKARLRSPGTRKSGS